MRSKILVFVVILSIGSCIRRSSDKKLSIDEGYKTELDIMKDYELNEPVDSFIFSKKASGTYGSGQR